MKIGAPLGASVFIQLKRLQVLRYISFELDILGKYGLRWCFWMMKSKVVRVKTSTSFIAKGQKRRFCNTNYFTAARLLCLGLQHAVLLQGFSLLTSALLLSRPAKFVLFCRVVVVSTEQSKGAACSGGALHRCPAMNQTRWTWNKEKFLAWLLSKLKFLTSVLLSAMFVNCCQTDQGAVVVHRGVLHHCTVLVAHYANLCISPS